MSNNLFKKSLEQMLIKDDNGNDEFDRLVKYLKNRDKAPGWKRDKRHQIKTIKQFKTYLGEVDNYYNVSVVELLEHCHSSFLLRDIITFMLMLAPNDKPKRRKSAPKK